MAAQLLVGRNKGAYCAPIMAAVSNDETFGSSNSAAGMLALAPAAELNIQQPRPVSPGTCP
jgi:hypothetical protein